MKFRVILSVALASLTLFFTAPAVSEQPVLVAKGIEVSQSDLVYYLRSQVRPDAMQASIDREGALEYVSNNIWVIRRLAQRALEMGAISQQEFEWTASNAASRKAMDKLLGQLVEERLEEVDWSTAARERYLAKPELYSKGEEVNASHILVSFDGRSWEEVNERVSEIQAKLDAGEDFYALAKSYSEDPSVERNGGTLGFFGKGAMYPSFEKAAFAMQEPGEVSEPVVSSFGVHFIRFEGRRAGDRPAFEQVAHLIVKDLKKEKQLAIRQALIEEHRSELNGETVTIDEQALRAQLGLGPQS